MLAFTKIDRINASKRGVMGRIKDFREVYEVFDENKAAEQAERCIGCGDPYCHNKCPLHNIIPAWLKQTANKDMELAFNISNETSPFPEILGRICPHDVLCEGDCTLNDTHGAITIGSVETFITETGFDNGLVPKFSTEKIGKKVAIIGSGPAGLSAATFLLRAGIDVEIFERASKAGGLLTYGIPGFKLDKHRIQRRVDFLIKAGAKVTLNIEIGVDKSFEELQNEFENVHLAMDFLTKVQKKEFGEPVHNYIDVKDKRVVVIGGGDTAMDCVRTSVREGASDVKCLYRRDEANMPGSKKEVDNSKEEGVEFVFNVSPVAITKNGITLDKTELTTADETGRQKVQIIPNSQYLQDADIVILALGFDQELPKFITDSSLELDKWNGIKVNSDYSTSINNIYAGGDGVRGADLAVTATLDGREAAKTIIASFK